MTRPALTRADWRRINRATRISEPEAFREAVDAVVRDRMRLAWDQGFDRGWTAGVRDANRDDGGGMAGRPRNPYA